MYFYCYVYVFLLRMFYSVYSVSLCCSMYYLCVNVYCTFVHFYHWTACSKTDDIVNA